MAQPVKRDLKAEVGNDSIEGNLEPNGLGTKCYFGEKLLEWCQ